MPTLELRCEGCGHTFERVLLRGEPPGKFACPNCGDAERVKPLPGSESPFEGLSPFGDMARDTN
jgi:putative FmdB family regulatory protein